MTTLISNTLRPAVRCYGQAIGGDAWEIDHVCGTVEMILDAEELCDLQEHEDDAVRELTRGVVLPDGIASVTWWHCERKRNRITLTVLDWEADPLADLEAMELR